MKRSLFLTVAVLAMWCVEGAGAAESIIRVGIVGCDTSHVIAFTKLMNNANASGVLARAQVCVAFPGGSSDLPSSYKRLPAFVAQLRERGVTIADSAQEVAEQADAVLLESVDGRVHLDQFRAVAVGKPVFVDKPAAASLADVLAIFRCAEATKTPVFSSSALRFCDNVAALAADQSIGTMIGCDAASPLEIEPHHPDLFWYGIHGVELLYALMGTGCETVSRVDSESSSVVVGKWRDGRLGTYRGLKEGHASYSFTVFGTDGVAQRSRFSGYEPLVRQICQFFITGKPPVSRKETVEIFAFMEAADESLRTGGRPVALQSILKRAEAKSNRHASTSTAPVDQ